MNKEKTTKVQLRIKLFKRRNKIHKKNTRNEIEMIVTRDTKRQ